SRLATIEDEAGPAAPEEFPTPGVRTIEDLTTFPGGAAAEKQIKTLVYVIPRKSGYESPLPDLAGFETPTRGYVARDKPTPVLALLRGDHQLHEIKLADSLGVTEIRPAHAEEIRELLGAGAGSLGAVGVKEKVRNEQRPTKFMPPIERATKFWSEPLIIADNGLKGRRNMTTGANKDDHHIRGVDVERDIEVDQWADLRTVASGEACPRCETGTLEVFKAMEIGHIFKLGTKYSESMGATVLTADGKEVPIVMGSYGIGVERIITAAIEQNNDADGIVWPKSITPFDVIVTVTNMKDEKLRDAGEKLYQDLQQAGLEVLLDDRDERAGVKFKDADLIGIPYRVTIGKKVSDGLIELFDRRAKSSEDVKLDEIAARVQELALAGA
ncbi:MAG TPA: His/Gly/Thr/Pro-type tRNA ligase C-terminal domain-containing protein, partial [Candidatus Udaeobacter sp.]|nr:His/Gly/Thr/Pro-type tRNA ligase C-terminal domain-containing protein [Candidatus Udaeobacter sp.]